MENTLKFELNINGRIYGSYVLLDSETLEEDINNCIEAMIITIGEKR